MSIIDNLKNITPLKSGHVTECWPVNLLGNYTYFAGGFPAGTVNGDMGLRAGS